MTRDKLEKEVAKLKSELTDSADSVAEPLAEAVAGAASAEPGDESSTLSDGVERLLADHGISTDDLGDLWHQLRQELHDLPEKKPLVTALGAFALGVMVGRISKR